MPFFSQKIQGCNLCENGTLEKGERLRIDSSYIGMDSARSYTSATKRTSRMEMKTYAGILEKREGSLNFQGMLLGGQEENTKAEKEGETTTGEDAGLSLRNRFRSSTVNKIYGRDEMKTLDKIRQQCITYLLELFDLKDRRKTKDDMTDVSEVNADGEKDNIENVTTTVFAETYRETYFEQEQTSFQTTGSVVTADGRTINFNLEMEMSRSFRMTYEKSYEMLYQNVNFCDPLVINLDENVASVSDQKFLFDIDADGVLDTISRLNEGSGYLAIDKNRDGTINDGSELFGPESGNGFADLAQYDEDGNGWIDEGDAIWEKLLIWTKDEDGRDKLYHVSEKGVGAICLQNQSTNFSLNSLRNNQTNAMIRSTGIFLYENGDVGTLQHVDMAK